jgi:membrane-bound ClpP family serine protease
MTLSLIIGLLVLAIFFLIVEIFLIPGISIAGFGSLLCFVAGITLAYMKLGAIAGTWTLGLTLLVTAGVTYWFYRSKTLDRMALKTQIDSKTEPFQGLDVRVGDTGKTISRLAPIGRILINGKTIEGRSENEMIEPETPIVVVEVGSYNVLVRRLLNNH